MDQAESEDQDLLWNEQKRRAHSSLDCTRHAAALGLLQIQNKTGTESYSDSQTVTAKPIQPKKSLGIVQSQVKWTKCAKWSAVMHRFHLVIAGQQCYGNHATTP